LPSIKIREELESFYKLKTVVILSFVLTFFLENHYIKFLEDPQLTLNFSTFFQSTSLLGLYGTLIGLLLTAYAMIVAVLPLFSTESLQKPIFSQINRLFVFTILDGTTLLLIYFTGGLIPLFFATSPLFIDMEIFFFFCLMIGLIFCVLTLSDLFKIIRKRGSR
jgi:hypothetical protein